MKNLVVFILMAFIVPTTATVEAQLLKKITSKTKRKADRKVDNSIDKGLNEIEGIFGNKEKNEGSEVSDEETKTEEELVNSESVSKPWSKFDFVPGDVILFEDLLVNEENGEFPSKWDLYSGNVENAEFEGENVINFSDDAVIAPLIEKPGDYLPEKFTIEFDIYFEQYPAYYYIYLYDQIAENGRSPEQLNNSGRILVRYNSAKLTNYEGEIEGVRDTDLPLWRHVAISFNIRSLKLYLDENRVLNIPNLKANPKGLSLEAKKYGESTMMVKNVKIAEGAKKLYDRFLTDGKIITTGIKFDTGKATLKPESMGTINEIFNLMNENPELKFSVEGHTDNVGSDESNMNLSEQRAETVMNTLISMGIDGSRLESKGMGESSPLYENTSDSGRANNRRVEFVKI